MFIDFRDDPATRPLDPAVALLGNVRQGAAFDFINMRGYVRDRGTPANFFLADPNDLLTYTSPSPKYVRGSNGLLSSGTTLRCDHDAAGNPLGLLAEGARTNVCVNSAFAGAAAGSPGTNPTGMSITGNNNGLTREIAIGTEDGEPYIDVRYFGTATATAFPAIVLNGSYTGPTASAGQTWVGSVDIKAVGTPSGGAGVFLETGQSGGSGTSSQALTLTNQYQRPQVVRTLATGATHVWSRVLVSVTNGSTVDITVRIRAPQLEQGAVPSSYIKTSGSQVTRAADNLTLAASLLPGTKAAGTLIAKVRPGTIGVEKTPFMMDGGNANDQIRAIVDTAGLFRQRFRLGASDLWYPVSSGVVGATGKIALAWDATTAVRALNGVAASLAISGNFTVLTSLRLGTFINLGAALDGHLEWLVYIPERLSNAELQARTAP